MAQNLNPATVAATWATNLGAATTKMKAGAQSLTVSPTQSAAAAVSKWQAAMADPNTAARYQSGLGRVSLQDWQTAYVTKGLPRVATGAQAAVPKFTTFLSTWLPFIQSAAATVRQMPSTTLQDRINRMVAMVNAEAGFKRS